MNTGRFLAAWGRILTGTAPMLSIEITRECPLRCPGCYAYDDHHLGGGVRLRELQDLHGDALVDGLRGLVERYHPIHLSIVGGEPLIRRRELGQVLPVLSSRKIETLIVTSGVIPIPPAWTDLPHIRVAVSVDGLAEDHDIRRFPATYEKILKNIRGCRVDISWVVTASQMEKPGYLDRYLSFWTGRCEVDRIWPSIYTPQVGEHSREMLTQHQREALVAQFPALKNRFPALLMTDGIAEAFLNPPRNPRQCVFARASVNYSADLKTQVQPCFFGGEPDCRQCGCVVTAGLHSIGRKRVLGPIRASHIMETSIAIGALARSATRGRL